MHINSFSDSTTWDVKSVFINNEEISYVGYTFPAVYVFVTHIIRANQSRRLRWGGV